MIAIHPDQLEALLQRAAQIGAQLGAKQAIEGMVCYHYKDACKRLGISYNTLQKRIQEGKIKPVDGRITGAELLRYLGQKTT